MYIYFYTCSREGCIYIREYIIQYGNNSIGSLPLRWAAGRPPSIRLNGADPNPIEKNKAAGKLRPAYNATSMKRFPIDLRRIPIFQPRPYDFAVCSDWTHLNRTIQALHGTAAEHSPLWKSRASMPDRADCIVLITPTFQPSHQIKYFNPFVPNSFPCGATHPGLFI